MNAVVQQHSSTRTWITSVTPIDSNPTAVATTVVPIAIKYRFGRRFQFKMVSKLVSPNTAARIRTHSASAANAVVGRQTQQSANTGYWLSHILFRLISISRIHTTTQQQQQQHQTGRD